MKINFAYVYYYPFLGRLLEGECTAQGLTFFSRQIFPPFKLFGALVESSPYELSEMSLSTYTLLRQRGWENYIALPIFTSRCFRHSSLYVRSDSDVTGPSQLRGKKVGVPEYHITAAVWVRGFLSEDFGVDPREVAWFTGGVEEPGRRERLELPHRLASQITPIGPGETLFGLLLQGRLDAVLSPHVPSLLKNDPSPVRRLFVNCDDVEKQYYRSHKIFPIMHTVVLRQDLYKEQPDLASRVYQVLKALKEDFYDKVRQVNHTLVFPWFNRYLDEVIEVLGGDPWPYGLSQNRHTVEKFLQYAFQQGLIERKPAAEELFVGLSD